MSSTSFSTSFCLTLFNKLVSLCSTRMKIVYHFRPQLQVFNTLALPPPIFFERVRCTNCRRWWYILQEQPLRKWKIQSSTLLKNASRRCCWSDTTRPPPPHPSVRHPPPQVWASHPWKGSHDVHGECRIAAEVWREMNRSIPVDLAMNFSPSQHFSLRTSTKTALV
jgi:hypothetical protein